MKNTFGNGFISCPRGILFVLCFCPFCVILVLDVVYVVMFLSPPAAFYFVEMHI